MQVMPPWLKTVLHVDQQTSNTIRSKWHWGKKPNTTCAWWACKQQAYCPMSCVTPSLLQPTVPGLQTRHTTAHTRSAMQAVSGLSTGKQ